MEPDAIRICSGSGVPQGVKSSTVQLAVSSPTEMMLDVSRDAHSQNYVVTGHLIFTGSGAKPVTLKVNDTAYELNTDSTGHFSKSLDLQPNNNQATNYVVTASFSGESNVKNVTAWSNTLNGTRYAACTTIQYGQNGYKPSANSTTIAIIPQSTETTTPTKTPEERKRSLETWMGKHLQRTQLNPLMAQSTNPRESRLPESGIERFNISIQTMGFSQRKRVRIRGPAQSQNSIEVGFYVSEGKLFETLAKHLAKEDSG